MLFALSLAFLFAFAGFAIIIVFAHFICAMTLAALGQAHKQTTVCVCSANMVYCNSDAWNAGQSALRILVHHMQQQQQQQQHANTRIQHYIECERCRIIFICCCSSSQSAKVKNHNWKWRLVFQASDKSGRRELTYEYYMLFHFFLRLGGTQMYSYIE